MPRITLGTTRLYYETLGSGEPLLALLPQSTGPRGNRALLDALATRYTLITYHQRGTGRSDPTCAGWAMDTLADDAIGLMDALQLTSTHLLCHSTGCGIGLSIASRRPERVDCLVLATPWSHADPHLHTMQTLRKAAALALDPEQYARFNAALLFPPDYRRANEPGFSEMARHAAAHPHDPVTISARLDAILAFDARAAWPAIASPTLVLTARDDQLMPPWFGAQTASEIRDAALVELDGGGHMILETRTDEVVDAVLSFLQDRSATRPAAGS